LLLGAVLIFLGLLVLLRHCREEAEPSEKFGEGKDRDVNAQSARKETNFANFADGEPGRDKWTARIRGGGVIMIGPIPVIFGSDSKTALIMMIPV
jgi:uncharacterized protein (TIGR00304 family)